MQNIVNDKEGKTHIGLGLSGGQDSTAALFVFYAANLPVHPIICDHQWMPESNQKALLVRTTCFGLSALHTRFQEKQTPSSLKVIHPCEQKVCYTRRSATGISHALALHPRSFCEDSARVWRYRIFDRISRKYALEEMCTGHTATDRVENTSSLEPLASGFTHPSVHRPTSFFTRWETKYLCLHYRLPCVCDPSNAWQSSRRTKQRIYLHPYQNLMNSV